MTTIAYKEGILAADTQLTFGGNIKGFGHKIITIRPGFVYAAVGDVSDDATFSYYLEQCEKLTNPRELERPKLKKGFECISIRDGIPFFADKSCVLTQLVQPFIAIGSGWQLATAALHMGMSAKDAVDFACQLDINSSTPIDIYDSSTSQKTNNRRKTRTQRTALPTETS